MTFDVEYITEISVPKNVFVVLKAGLESQDEFSVRVKDDHLQFRYESDCLIRINRGLS